MEFECDKCIKLRIVGIDWNSFGLDWEKDVNLWKQTIKLTESEDNWRINWKF